MTSTSSPLDAPRMLTNGRSRFIRDRQLLLFFLQVCFRVVQKELIVFVHGERAAVDQQYHQHRRQHAPRSSATRTSVPYSHLRRRSAPARE